MKKILFILFIIHSSLLITNAQWVFTGFAPPGLGGGFAISTPNCSTIVLAGGPVGTGIVFRSTNSGGSFINITGNLGSLELYTVWAKNKDTIFVGDGGSSGGAGGNAKVYRTYNGGLNWTLLLSTGGSAGFINGIIFERPLQRFGIIQSDPPTGTGQPFWLYKTNDGGNTWTSLTVPGVPGAASLLNSVYCIDSLFFGFGLSGSPPRIYRTTNGGLTWIITTLPLTGSFITGITFSSDKQYGIAATSTSLPNIARTTDGGNSWFVINAGGSGYCNMRWVYSTNVCFLSGSTGMNSIRKSTNAGANWSAMTTAGISGITQLGLAYENNNMCGYAIASDGSMIRLTETISGVEGNNGVPVSYKLFQNYPNPFNPSTVISFQLAVNSFASLKVYDVLGREVATLVNEQLKPGTYEVDWDVSGFSSGVYFYTLEADPETNSGFRETKKMLLIK